MAKILVILTILLLILSSPLSFADYKVIDGDAGQQAILSDTRAVTVFRDGPITMRGQIGGYIDSSELETNGYDKMEWYYLKGIGEKAVIVETLKYDLKLPAYVSENEEKFLTTVRLTENKGMSGIFVTHEVNIRITVKDAAHVEMEIVE